MQSRLKIHVFSVGYASTSTRKPHKQTKTSNISSSRPIMSYSIWWNGALRASVSPVSTCLWACQNSTTQNNTGIFLFFNQLSLLFFVLPCFFLGAHYLSQFICLFPRNKGLKQDTKGNKIFWALLLFLLSLSMCKWSTLIISNPILCVNQRPTEEFTFTQTYLHTEWVYPAGKG